MAEQFFHKRYVKGKRFSHPSNQQVNNVAFPHNQPPMTISINATSNEKAMNDTTSAQFDIVQEAVQPKHLLDLASKYLQSYQQRKKKSNTTVHRSSKKDLRNQSRGITEIQMGGKTNNYSTFNVGGETCQRKDIMTPPSRLPHEFGLKQQIEPLRMFGNDGRVPYTQSSEESLMEEPLSSTSARRVIYSKNNRQQPIKSQGSGQANVKYDREKYRKYYQGNIKPPNTAQHTSSSPPGMEHDEFSKACGQFPTFADYIKHTNHSSLQNGSANTSVFKPNFLSNSPRIIRQKTDVVDGHNIPTFLYTQRGARPLMGPLNYRKNPFPQRNMRNELDKSDLQSFPIQMQDQRTPEHGLNLPETLQSSRQTIEAARSPLEGDSLVNSLHSNQLASDEETVQTVTLQPRHLAENSTDSVSSGKRAKPVKPLDMNATRNYVHIKKVATTAQGTSRLKSYAQELDSRRKSMTPAGSIAMSARGYNQQQQQFSDDDEYDEEKIPVEYVAIKAQNGAHWLDLDMIKEKKKLMQRNQKRMLCELNPMMNIGRQQPPTSSHAFRKPSWNLEQFLLHQQNQSKYWRNYITKVEQQKSTHTRRETSPSPAPVVMQTT